MTQQKTTIITALDYVESKGSEYGSCFHFACMTTRYGGSEVYAVLLIGDNPGGIADKLADSDYWHGLVEQYSRFPVAAGSTHFQALENLKKKLSEIPYSWDWVTWVGNVTDAISDWDGETYPDQSFGLHTYKETQISNH